MTRNSPPEDIPVQLNIKIPWRLKEDLSNIAKIEEKSITQVVKHAIEYTYADFFAGREDSSLYNDDRVFE